MLLAPSASSLTSARTWLTSRAPCSCILHSETFELLCSLQSFIGLHVTTMLTWCHSSLKATHKLSWASPRDRPPPQWRSLPRSHEAVQEECSFLDGCDLRKKEKGSGDDPTSLFSRWRKIPESLKVTWKFSSDLLRQWGEAAHKWQQDILNGSPQPHFELAGAASLRAQRRSSRSLMRFISRVIYFSARNSFHQYDGDEVRVTCSSFPAARRAGGSNGLGLCIIYERRRWLK